jgi:hypothetical protein
MAEKAHKVEVTAEGMVPKTAVTAHKVGTADHRIIAPRGATVRKAADRRATILKAIMAAKPRSAGMVERKATIHKGATPHTAHNVDRANKALASTVGTAARTHRPGSDHMETSRQGKGDMDRKVGTAPKAALALKVAMALELAMILKPVCVRRTGSKPAGGARRAGTNHRRDNSRQVTAEAGANNQDTAPTAAKAVAMEPRRATAHTGATVLKAVKRRAVAEARTRAVRVRLDGTSKAARNAADRKAINDPMSGSRKTSASN